MCITSVYEARNNLSSLIKKAQEGEVIQITNHNKAVAYIVSADAYQREHELNKASNWLTEWKKWHEEAKDYLDDEGIPLPPRDDYMDTEKIMNLFGGDDE